MSDPIQDLMRALYQTGTRIAITPNGTIELSGKQPPVALMDEVRANKDAVLDRMEQQGIGKGQDQYPGALPFRYTVPACCLADKHCRRRGLCSAHLHGHRCGTNEPEDAGQPRTEDELIDQTVGNILAMTSTEIFQLAQELLNASSDDPNIEYDSTAFLIALSVIVAAAWSEEVPAA